VGGFTLKIYGRLQEINLLISIGSIILVVETRNAANEEIRRERGSCILGGKFKLMLSLLNTGRSASFLPFPVFVLTQTRFGQQGSHAQSNISAQFKIPITQIFNLLPMKSKNVDIGQKIVT
jgi:hypothetical protein